ncbi:MAG: hypothetical protein RBS24_06485 [Bacilli bacterium]|nr:hypothetical protein [Bacilli bacterium]
MMIQYVRKGKSRVPFGTMTAEKLTSVDGVDYISLGWSICNKEDTFFKSIGKERAMSRARGHHLFECDGGLIKMEIPPSFAKKFKRFAQRASAYFQTKNFQNEYVFTTTEVITKVEKLDV